MSILIKGMEMPDIENNKSIKAEIRNLDGKLELGIMTGGYYCSQQWTYYPLVSVPTPHGRLGDLDRLYKHIKAECNIYGKPTIGFEDGNKVLKIIADTRTVIEAEVEE